MITYKLLVFAQNTWNHTNVYRNNSRPTKMLWNSKNILTTIKHLQINKISALTHKEFMYDLRNKPN